MSPKGNSSARSGAFAGFAVVEVVLAIGIAAFALTAVLGLCSVALNSSKGSTDDTVLAEISNNILGELRSQSFYERRNQPTLLLYGLNDPADLPGSVKDPADIPKITLDRYYDSAGVRIMIGNPPVDITETAAEFRNAAYHCRITLQGDFDTLGVTEDNLRDINLLNVRIEFFWPAQDTTPPNEKTFNGTVPRT